MCLKCVHNYGSFELLLDYSVSLVERHLSLVRSPLFAFVGLLLIEGVYQCISPYQTEIRK